MQLKNESRRSKSFYCYLSAAQFLDLFEMYVIQNTNFRATAGGLYMPFILILFGKNTGRIVQKSD